MAFRNISGAKQLCNVLKFQNNKKRALELSFNTHTSSAPVLTRLKSTQTDFQEGGDGRAPSSKVRFSQWASSSSGECRHPDVDLTFANAKEAYRCKTTAELVRALFVFSLCSIEPLVNNQKELLKVARKVLGQRLFVALMKKTFYGHFVAGASQEEIRVVVGRNQGFGVKSILDYSAEEDLTAAQATEAMESGAPAAEASENPDDEASRYRAHEEFADRREGVTGARTYFYEGEEQCDKNMHIFLDCIDAVSHATEKSGLAAIKLTALGKPHLLMQMSEVLCTTRNLFRMLRKSQGEIDKGQVRFSLENLDPYLKDIGVQLEEGGQRAWVSIKDISEQGKEVDLLDWQNLLELNRSLSKLLVIPNLKTGKLQPLVQSISEAEEDQMKNMLRRVNRIARYAQEKEVRIMIDAEQTYFQPAISRLTMEMMRKFNRERSVIFNTYQCYLKESFDEVVVDMDMARREDFYFGAKLVRGAYMEQERERAASLGYEDPINPSYEATTEMYHSVVEEVMRQMHLREKGKMAVMIASHNEDTVRYAIEKMKEYDIEPNDRVICFGQLFGMCDQISFPLGQAGYSVYKYVPYGPVEEVLPYLSRRAAENRGVLAKVKKEKGLLRQEIFRRLFTGQLFYKPAPPPSPSVAPGK